MSTKVKKSKAKKSNKSPKQAKRRRAKSRAKQAKRRVSKRSSAQTIDLVVDDKYTLDELDLKTLHVFYTQYYTPIKQACAVHNALLKTENRSACEYIEASVDAMIETMNAWLDKTFDQVRAQSKKSKK